MNKLDAQAKLSKQHDIIKSHPYRVSFNPQWRRDYIECLFGLSNIWAEYIWQGAHKTKEEAKLMLQFGRWVHNYNQELLFYRGRPNEPFNRFYYYEQMLQITHLFIGTGELPEYYEITYLWNSEHTRCSTVEKYELITKEMCGIDSNILPCYLPIKYSMNNDSEAVKNYIMTNLHYSRKTAEEKENIYQNYLCNVAPVIDWINARHEETKYKHAVWETAHIT